MADSGRPPPSYEQATGTNVPKFSRRERNGIPPEARRSMEDEQRPLPRGWVRTFDSQHKHQFFVDTTAEPPRSTWHHPYDDEQYLSTLSSEERRRVKDLTAPHPAHHDIIAESSDEEDDVGDDASRRPSPSHSSKGGIGRRLKDRLTGTSHEQRAAERQRRAQREREVYQQHQSFRHGLDAAMTSGRPQLIGKDGNGADLYLEPPGARFPGVTGVNRLSSSCQEVFYAPNSAPVQGVANARFIRPDGDIFEDGMDVRSGYGYGYGYGSGGYPGRYAAQYQRPYGAYARPYGNGYGGGLGYPMMGSLLGGVMLGGLMF